MWIKISGACLIFLGCTFLGMKKSKELYKREKYLRNIKTALKMLEGEICFSSNYLKNAFFNIWRISETGDLFYDAAIYLEEKNSESAWCYALSKNQKKLFLKDKDVEVLNVFSSDLGMSDTHQQEKNIKHIISLLDIQILQANEEYKKSSKLYRSMGVLSGIFFVILLL